MLRIIILSAMLLPLLLSCSTPHDDLKNTYWGGKVISAYDGRKLNDVLLYMRGDTMLIYSDAIYGSEHDTLLLQEYVEEDSILKYRSLSGMLFTYSFHTERLDTLNCMMMTADDHYILVARDLFKFDTLDPLRVYSNRPVPRLAYIYLEGAYEGEVEMENSLQNMYLGSIGGMRMKLVFEEGFKVRVYAKNLLASLFSAGSNEPDYERVSYAVQGNRLILEGDTERSIEVRQEGQVLVLATDKARVIFQKTY